MIGCDVTGAWRRPDELQDALPAPGSGWLRSWGPGVELATLGAATCLEATSSTSGFRCRVCQLFGDLGPRDLELVALPGEQSHCDH